MTTSLSNRRKWIAREVTRLYADAGLMLGLYAFVRLKLAPMVKIEEFVPKEGTILDLGCGNGVFANILFLGSNQRVVKGIDISARRIENAKRVASQNQNLEFSEGDVSRYSLNSCEAVTVIDLLHHMEFHKQEFLLRKLHDGISEQTMVLIKDLEKAPWWKYAVHYAQDSLSYRSRLYFRSEAEMQSDLRKIGFDVETISLAAGYMHPHILYRCRKRTDNPLNSQRGK
jgi:2-polyprenyl-3-methyl-5-hydroxy-6-metoxy-1,4-benzoquinol methylase